MAKYSVEDKTFSDIADAIREKTGDTADLTPLEMPDAIKGITGGGSGSGVLGTTLYFNDYEEADNSQFHQIDVSNANTLSFKYDFHQSSNSGYKTKIYVSNYYGYTLELATNKTVPRFEPVLVDEEAATARGDVGIEWLCNAISTSIEGGEAVLDVSDFTTFVFKVRFYPQGTIGYGSLKIYDIALS